jgi:hypothetical protein
VSFWAKSTSTHPSSITLVQNFGSGGSAEVSTTVATSPTYTGSFVRYSYTVSVPSISGKTIGTSSYLSLSFNFPLSAATPAFSIWGVQVEAGSVATPFQTTTGTIQGELAACQRYFYKHAEGNTVPIGLTTSYSTTLSIGWISLPVTMRITPTIVATTGTNFYAIDIAGAGPATTALTIGAGSNSSIRLDGTYSGLTAGQAGYLRTNNTDSFLAFTSEL